MNSHTRCHLLPLLFLLLLRPQGPALPLSPYERIRGGKSRTGIARERPGRPGGRRTVSRRFARDGRRKRRLPPPGNSGARARRCVPPGLFSPDERRRQQKYLDGADAWHVLRADTRCPIGVERIPPARRDDPDKRCAHGRATPPGAPVACQIHRRRFALSRAGPLPPLPLPPSSSDRCRRARREGEGRFSSTPRTTSIDTFKCCVYKVCIARICRNVSRASMRVALAINCKQKKKNRKVDAIESRDQNGSIHFLVGEICKSDATVRRRGLSRRVETRLTIGKRVKGTTTLKEMRNEYETTGLINLAVVYLPVWSMLSTLIYCKSNNRSRV